MIQKCKGGAGHMKQVYKLNTRMLEDSEAFFIFMKNYRGDVGKR
jgi:hypothetical protein